MIFYKVDFKHFSRLWNLVHPQCRMVAGWRLPTCSSGHLLRHPALVSRPNLKARTRTPARLQRRKVNQRPLKKTGQLWAMASTMATRGSARIPVCLRRWCGRRSWRTSSAISSFRNRRSRSPSAASTRTTCFRRTGMDTATRMFTKTTASRPVSWARYYGRDFFFLQLSKIISGFIVISFQDPLKTFRLWKHLITLFFVVVVLLEKKLHMEPPAAPGGGQQMATPKGATLATCESCGKMDFVSKFRRSKRFCSTACSKKYSISIWVAF